MKDWQTREVSALTLKLMCACLLVLPMWRVGYYDIGLFRDDAGIVFVYARNLVETGQIFYNFPADRLDGFTSTIDVLFAALLYLVAPDSMFVWNFYVKALITSLVPILVLFVLRRWGLGIIPAFLVAAALALSEVLAATFGMQLEGPLYAAGIIMFFVALFGRHKFRLVAAAGLGFILALTRPEALVLVGVAFAACWLFCDEDDIERRSQTLWSGLAAISGIGLWYLWRIFHFGYWAPNTYYAKMSGTRWQEITDGFNFVVYHFLSRADVFIYLALFLLVLAAIPQLFKANKTAGEEKFWVLSAVAFAMLAVRIGTGGDSYQFSARLLTDFAVPAFLAVGLALSFWHSGWLRNAIVAFVAVALVGNAWILARNMPENLAAGFIRMEREFNAGLECEFAAMRLVNSLYPQARLAHTDFQRAKYFAPELEVLDLSGLNNRDIAHRVDGKTNIFGKHDLQYGLDRQAELWKMSTGVMERTPLHEIDWPVALQSGEGLEDRFRGALDFMQQNYTVFSEQFVPLSVRTQCGTYLNMLLSRDLANADYVYLETR